MAIHSPNVFHNTIGAASIKCPVADFISEPEQNVPVSLSGSTTDVITPKNIKTTGGTTKFIFTASWLGYYFVQFNATASYGTDKLWQLTPYKNLKSYGIPSTL